MPVAHDILARLPHRYPFHFITEVVDLAPQHSARGVWRVQGHEEFLAGHFPGHPLVPGVLIAEALAQISGLIAFADDEGRFGDPQKRAPATLAHVDVRFHASVQPPAEIILQSKLSRALGRLMQFEVAAHVVEIRVASGSITLAAGERSELDVRT